jgi:hypothetical protein
MRIKEKFEGNEEVKTSNFAECPCEILSKQVYAQTLGET